MNNRYICIKNFNPYVGRETIPKNTQVKLINDNRICAIYDINDIYMGTAYLDEIGEHFKSFNDVRKEKINKIIHKINNIR